jgi:hypothetical protein
MCVGDTIHRRPRPLSRLDGVHAPTKDGLHLLTRERGGEVIDNVAACEG